MRLAAVSFNYAPDQIGGGHVPALAFCEWAKILGHECDLVEMDQTDDGVLVLGDTYDGIFYCTPPMSLNCLPEETPYVVMIHAEFDAYNAEVMEYAKAVVMIDQDRKHWSFDNMLYWHPCCEPKYLLTGNEVFHKHKRGTLYAARVSTWKNANTLVAYSNLDAFQDAYGPVAIFGKANKAEFGEFVDTAIGKVSRYNETFHKDGLEKEYRHHEFFWDVSGTNEYNLDIKRLNLAAFEAMKFGCIPIVNKDAIPEVLHDITIDFREVLPAFNNPFTLNSIRAKIKEKATKEYFGYNAVKEQVTAIIEVFENERTNPSRV